MAVELALDTGLDTAVQRQAPQPVAVAWQAVVEPTASPAERLGRVPVLVEAVLRLLHAVLDAERAGLDLRPPDAARDLVRRFDRGLPVGLGHWGKAVEALARQLRPRPDRVVPLAADILVTGGREPRRTAFAAALDDLRQSRNALAHDARGMVLDEDEARVCLRRLADGPWGVIATTLPELAPLAPAWFRHRGGGEGVPALLFRGVAAVRARLDGVSARTPGRRLIVVGRDGDALVLDPWWRAGTFGESASPHLRHLALLERGRPRYCRAGSRDRGEPLEGDYAGEDLASLTRRVRPVARLSRGVAGGVFVEVAAERPVVPGVRLLRPLGEGGSGTVWLGERDGRRVAVKVLRPEVVSDPRQRARLRHEYALLQRVIHPGVVRVLDFVERPGEAPALVLEYVRGRTLAQRLADGPLEPAEAARVALAVLDALHAVHGTGVVHRDLKPSNVIFGDDGRPRLVDFGIARHPDLSTITASGEFVGTAAFAAPEQRAGARVDARTDLYAVGRLLVAMAGAGASERDALRRLPPGLQAVVRRALCDDPAARYPSARDMASALRFALDDGFRGPPLELGTVLEGGVRLERLAAWRHPWAWAFHARPAVGTEPMGVLLATGPHRAELERAVAARPESLRLRHRVQGPFRDASGLAWFLVDGRDVEGAVAALFPDGETVRRLDGLDLLAGVGAVAAAAAGAAVATALSRETRRWLASQRAARPEAREGAPGPRASRKRRG